MDKEDVAHTYNERLLNPKKEQNNAIRSTMDGTRDCHSEWSKSGTERQISHDITQMEDINKKVTNELIYTTETDSQT